MINMKYQCAKEGQSCTCCREEKRVLAVIMGRALSSLSVVDECEGSTDDHTTIMLCADCARALKHSLDQMLKG